MRILKDNDYALFERLVSLTQREIHTTLGAYLQTKYPNKTTVTNEYIVAIGDIPVALIAHMDTVFKFPVQDLYYDQNKNVLWSPQGLGSDDRAGLFAILQIIKRGLRPSIILTTDEEIGGLGASALAEKKCPIPDLRYMIQLDRRGKNDCIFYDCYNPDFFQYVEKFGFVQKRGTFSDISFLMPAWDICGVNLSIGYEDEHSIAETLNVTNLFDTIDKVEKMLRDQDIPHFRYDELPGSFSFWNSSKKESFDVYSDFDFECRCCKCYKAYSEYEIFPVKGMDGIMKLYCPDCIVGNVDWCEICGEAYEIVDPTQKSRCNDCVGVKG